MKHLKKFNEGMTVSDWRDEMSYKSKDIHKNNSKEFYLVTGDRQIFKYIIPEKFRGDFEEEYTGGEYGSFFKDTAEFIAMYAEEAGASMVIMDYEMDSFVKSIQWAIKDEGYDIEKEDGTSN